MRKSWNIVNQIRCKMKKLTSPTYLEFNGKLITNRRDVACHLNKYFTGVAHQLNVDKYGESLMDESLNFKRFLKNRVSSTMFFTDIDSNEIQSVIRKLNDTESSDFSVRAIKIVKHQISPLLATLFNDCMYSGIFPDELKLAKVLPLYKGGKTHIMSNHRPISILPLCSKIFEKLIYTRLYFLSVFTIELLLSVYLKIVIIISYTQVKISFWRSPIWSVQVVFPIDDHPNGR